MCTIQAAKYIWNCIAAHSTRKSMNFNEESAVNSNYIEIKTKVWRTNKTSHLVIPTSKKRWPWINHVSLFNLYSYTDCTQQPDGKSPRGEQITHALGAFNLFSINGASLRFCAQQGRTLKLRTKVRPAHISPPPPIKYFCFPKSLSIFLFSF